jgi:glyoxylase-like metal-dependent hydrolase (beta-lactamase superfamily II)
MRRILLVLLLLVVLLPTLVLAVILVPAHLQIRRIDPPLPEVSTLLGSVDVANGPTRIRYVNSATQGTADGRDMGHVAFVLDWEDGRRFVIDLGMEPEVAIEFGKPLETLLGFDPAVAHGAVADQMGDGVASVRGVGFTHLHHDHTQGIVAFCRSHQISSGRALPIYQTPFQFEQRNYTTDMGHVFVEEARSLAGSAGCATPTRLDVGRTESVHPIPGFPGLIAIPAGGHTPGSTLFFTQVDDHYWLFSGDITNTRRELIENLPKEVIYSLLIVPEYTDRTERMRVWLRDLDARSELTVVVSHDLTALEETAIRAW